MNVIAKYSQNSDTVGSVGYLNKLGKVGWLAEQPYDFQRKIASLGRWVTYSAGQRIYSYDFVGDALIGLDQGSLDIMFPVTSSEEFAFFRAKPGFWMGDNGIQKNERIGVSVETATECRLFKVPHLSLRQHLARRPSDWAHLNGLAQRRSVSFEKTLAELLALPPKARVARLLLRLEDSNGLVTSKQEDLGRFAGMCRATFRRTLHEFISSGVVETLYGKIRINNRELLMGHAILFKD